MVWGAEIVPRHDTPTGPDMRCHGLFEVGDEGFGSALAVQPAPGQARDIGIVLGNEHRAQGCKGPVPWDVARKGHG